MTFKAQWYRDKFAKKRGKGFCGYPVATAPSTGRTTQGDEGLCWHRRARRC